MSCSGCRLVDRWVLLARVTERSTLGRRFRSRVYGLRCFTDFLHCCKRSGLPLPGMQVLAQEQGSSQQARHQDFCLFQMRNRLGLISTGDRCWRRLRPPTQDPPWSGHALASRVMPLLSEAGPARLAQRATPDAAQPCLRNQTKGRRASVARSGRGERPRISGGLHERKPWASDA